MNAWNRIARLGAGVLAMCWLGAPASAQTGACCLLDGTCSVTDVCSASGPAPEGAPCENICLSGAGCDGTPPRSSPVYRRQPPGSAMSMGTVATTSSASNATAGPARRPAT